jgi:hypothetical protein
MNDPQAAAGPLIHGIPLALWVAIAVGILSPAIALLSVFIASRNARVLLKKQLAHDADQRNRERTMSLRREVYLEAAGALITLQTLLGKVADLDHDQKAVLDAFSDGQAKLAKVQIVGSQRTVEAVMAYINALAPAFIELLSRRAPLAVRKSAIDTHDGSANKALVEQERFVAMTQQYNLEGITDQQKRKAVDDQFKLAQQRFEYNSGRANELRIEQMTEILEIGRRSVTLVKQITRLLPNAVLAVRSEFEIPLDEERYQQLANAQIADVDRVYTEAMGRLRSMMDQSAASDSGARSTPVIATQNRSSPPQSPTA